MTVHTVHTVAALSDDHELGADFATEATTLARTLADALRAACLRPDEHRWLDGLERGIADGRPADAVDALHRTAGPALADSQIVEFMVAADHVADVLDGPEPRARQSLSTLARHVREQVDALGRR